MQLKVEITRDSLLMTLSTGQNTSVAFYLFESLGNGVQQSWIQCLAEQDISFRSFMLIGSCNADNVLFLATFHYAEQLKDAESFTVRCFLITKSTLQPNFEVHVFNEAFVWQI